MLSPICFAAETWKGWYMKSNRKKSRAQEEKIAAEMGGRVQPGSGNQPLFKSDVVNTMFNFRVEAKTTGKKTYRIDKSTIEKIRREALLAGENWLLQIDFEQKPARRCAVLDYDVLLMILEEVHGGQKT